MKLRKAVIAAAAVAVTAVSGGCGAAQAGFNPSGGGTVVETTKPTSTPPPSTSPVSTPQPSETTPDDSPESTAVPTETPKSEPEPTEPADDDSTQDKSTAADKLSEENLIRERLYYDLTRHSFMGDKPGKGQKLGACTGDKTFASVLPQGVPILSYAIAGEGGLEVVNQVAQTGSNDEARAAADKIVKLVKDCSDAIPGGDFGYGEPESVESNKSRKVVYLPAFDSDHEAGGYIVIQADERVAVVDANDTISHHLVARLAQETASITAD